MCPCCNSKFDRWGHLQSFDWARIGILLEQDYEVGNLSEHDFVTWGTLNWKGRIGCVLRIMLRALGPDGSGKTIYFCARKLNGPDDTLAA